MTSPFHGTSLDAPFPGLRAFEADESLLFYGREAHVADLLERMGDTRFVAVIGTSGSGKSSLVRAGLRPALQRGYLIDTTSRWRFALMRPGSAPIEALSDALAAALGHEPIQQIRRTLGATSAGLAQVVARAGLEPGESLLVIADQFEELFRFDVTRDQEANASLFVSLLLAATEQREVPVYVVVTMRSEFLGRCSEFTGLAEAFNRSQYLVPRLTRDERREAIERPLTLFGSAASPALVQQALNDAGDDPDQLPVLQHVLLRTYRAWRKGGATDRLEREHYHAVGGIERALDGHGDEIFGALGDAAQKTAEQLFRSLTVSQGGVALRRPRRMRELYAIADASSPEAQQRVDAVVTAFAHRDNSFLMLSSVILGPETVVDITHESLIRKWKRLAAWVHEERRSAEWYSDLARDVARYRIHEVGLWEDPELAGVNRRRRDEGWNEAWANQYRRPDDPQFSEALAFLDESARAQDDQRRKDEEQRDRELRQAQALATVKRRQLFASALLLVAVGAIAVVLYSKVQTDQKLAQATADYQRLSDESQTAQARRSDLEAQLERLSRGAAAATPADQVRLLEEKEQLTARLESARAQEKARAEELANLRRDQELTTSDRGGLLRQIDTLKQQLSDASKAGSPQASAAPPGPSADRASALEKELQAEQTRNAEAAKQIAMLTSEIASLRGANSTSAPVATIQQVTKAFTDGVRAYDLKDWQASVQYMQEAIKMQSSVKQPPKEVRMSGTRFVPYAPHSYLGTALFEMKSDCTAVLSALKQAETEAVPPDIRGQLQRARGDCAR